MATVQKLLIDVFVAAAAVPRGQLAGDHEAVMILFVLAGSGLMAVEAVHTFLGVQAHLVFVNHRILSPGVAFSAFSGGPHEIRSGLVGLDLRPRAIEQERCQNECKCNDNGDEHRSKRHSKPQSVKNAVYPGPADDNGNIVVGVEQKATCSARLCPGKVKLTLADVMHVPNDSDGSEAGNKNNSPKNQRNPEGSARNDSSAIQKRA